MFSRCFPSIWPQTTIPRPRRRPIPSLRTTPRSPATTRSGPSSGSRSNTAASSNRSIQLSDIQVVNVSPVASRDNEREAYIRSLDEWKNQEGLSPEENEGRKKAVDLILRLQDTSRDLNLSNLHLSQIPPLWFYSQLRTIDLSKNKLSMITERDFFGLTSLNSICLSKNQISTLDEKAFSQNINLIFLFLEENQITTIPEKTFSTLSKLMTLFLNHNQLSEIAESTFAGLTSLISLDLEYNPLSAIHPKAFSPLSKLSELRLSSTRNLVLHPTTYEELQTRQVDIVGYTHPTLLSDEISQVYAMANRALPAQFDWRTEDNFAGFLNLLQRLTAMDYFNNDSTKVEAYSSFCDLLDKMAFSAPLRQVCFHLAHAFSTDCVDAIAVGFFQMQIHAGYIDSIYKQTETATLDQRSKIHFYNLAVDLAKLDIISKRASDIAQSLNLGDVIELQLKLLIECRHQFPNVTLSHMNYPGMAEVVTPDIITEINTDLEAFRVQPLTERLRQAVIQQLASFPAVHVGCKFNSISNRVYDNSHEQHPNESEHDYIVRCNQAKDRYEQETTKAVRDFFSSDLNKV